MRKEYTLSEFGEYIKNNILNHLPAQYKEMIPFIKNNVKNNNIVYCGIGLKNKTANAVPIIYLNDVYEDYLHDKVSLIDALDIVSKMIIQNPSLNIDTQSLMTFANIKDQISCRLINYENNKEGVLKDVPFVKWNDLAVIYQVTLPNLDVCHNDYNSSFVITNNIKDIYGVSTEDLNAIAISNMEKLNNYSFKSFYEATKDLINIENEEFFNFLYPPMFVLTNNILHYGAAQVLNENALSYISDSLNADCYMIPSSVHEVIFIPCEVAENMKETKDDDIIEILSNMVELVNKSELAKDEVLSNSVCFFDHMTKEICLVNKEKEYSDMDENIEK